MRAREYLGPSPWLDSRGEGFKIDTVHFGCQPLGTPSAGIVVVEPIPRRRGDWQSGVVLIIRTIV